MYVYSDVSMKKSEEQKKMLKIPFDVVYGCERINILNVDKLEKGPWRACHRMHITYKMMVLLFLLLLPLPLENVAFRIQPSI